MATLHLLVGLPGSGKTTRAKEIEAAGAVRLSPDEWMARIVGDGYDAERREAVHAVQWEIAQRLLTLGVDVVLEFGFFRRRERDAFKAGALSLGAEVRIEFLDAPRRELLRRLLMRNANLPPDTFPVSEEHLDLCISWFEPPTAEELGRPGG
jgi:predicted kinase